MRRSRHSRRLGRALMLHPAAAMFVWLTVLLSALSVATSKPIIGVALLAVASGLTGVLAFPRLSALTRRTRYLVLAIALSSMVMTPGELLSLFPWITYEGLLMAATQLLSLSMVLVSVSLLLHFVLPQELVLGMLFLLQPIRRLGVDTTPLAVRMTLVLSNFVPPGDRPQTRFRHVIKQLATESPLPTDENTICLEQRPWLVTDHMACSLALIGSMFVFSLTSTGSV